MSVLLSLNEISQLERNVYYDLSDVCSVVRLSHPHALVRGVRGVGGGGGGGVVVMQDVSPLSTSLIVPLLFRDAEAACWTVVMYLDEPPTTADTFNYQPVTTRNITTIDDHSEEDTTDYKTTINNNNQVIER